MDHNVAQQIGDLVSGGNQIGAIKLLRETTGLGLAEAKAVIDAVAGGGRLPPDLAQRLAARAAVTAAATVSAADELPPEVRRLAVAGNRLEAIKQLREQRGLGLKEAKDLIDRAVPLPAGKRGCLLPLLGGVMLAGAGWWCC